jgi:hypothetical protein
MPSLDTMAIARLKPMPRDFILQAWLQFCCPVKEVQIAMQGLPLLVMVAPSVLHLMQALVLRCVPGCSELGCEGVENMRHVQRLANRLATEIKQQQSDHVAGGAATTTARAAGRPITHRADMASGHWPLTVLLTISKVNRSLLDKALSSTKLLKRVITTSSSTDKPSSSHVTIPTPTTSSSPSSSKDSTTSQTQRQLAEEVLAAAAKADIIAKDQLQSLPEERMHAVLVLAGCSASTSPGVTTGGRWGTIRISWEHSIALQRLWKVLSGILGSSALVAGSWLLRPQAALFLCLLRVEHGRGSVVDLLLPVLEGLMQAKDGVEQLAWLCKHLLLDMEVLQALCTVWGVLNSVQPGSKFFVVRSLAVVSAVGREMKKERDGGYVEVGFHNARDRGLAARLGTSPQTLMCALKQELLKAVGHNVKYQKWVRRLFVSFNTRLLLRHYRCED